MEPMCKPFAKCKKIFFVKRKPITDDKKNWK